MSLVFTWQSLPQSTRLSKLPWNVCMIRIHHVHIPALLIAKNKQTKKQQSTAFSFVIIIISPSDQLVIPSSRAMPSSYTHKTRFRIQVKGHGEGIFTTSHELKLKETGPEVTYRLLFLSSKYFLDIFIKKKYHLIIKIQNAKIPEIRIYNLLFYKGEIKYLFVSSLFGTRKRW